MNTLVQCETRMRTTVGCRVLVARAEHGTDFHHFGPRTRTLATVHCSRRGRGGLDGFCGSDLTMPKYCNWRLGAAYELDVATAMLIASNILVLESMQK
jgi:hypothetical protein